MSVNLTDTSRAELIHQIAQKWTTRADISELEGFYYDGQVEFLKTIDDSEIVRVARTLQIPTE